MSQWATVFIQGAPSGSESESVRILCKNNVKIFSLHHGTEAKQTIVKHWPWRSFLPHFRAVSKDFPEGSVSSVLLHRVMVADGYFIWRLWSKATSVCFQANRRDRGLADLWYVNEFLHVALSSILNNRMLSWSLCLQLQTGKNLWLFQIRLSFTKEI